MLSLSVFFEHKIKANKLIDLVLALIFDIVSEFYKVNELICAVNMLINSIEF
jgi:hypothetical protein